MQSCQYRSMIFISDKKYYSIHLNVILTIFSIAVGLYGYSARYDQESPHNKNVI